ncbi:MAG: AAA family ATPase, partial [Thermomicrobiales bacterium]
MSTGTFPRRINLPVSLTPLLGRDEVIEDLVRLMSRSDVRLITLSGPGGIGKTRIAIEAGRRLATRYDDRVQFVHLSSLRDPALVLKTTAQTLDVEEDRDLPLDAIAKRLGDQPWLLILDNFEHLAPAATDVSDLLSRCSMLDILVTSRTRLQLQGEH